MKQAKAPAANIFDAIIVGGGPAGLSCALVLGRCRRAVLVFDTGEQRNKVSQAMHAFPSRDGEHPRVFLNTVKKELLHYGIRVGKKEIVSAQFCEGTFTLTTSAGETIRCRKLLLATGVRDKLPPLNGAEAYYGKGVYHCPYCDGWENKDRPWVVFAESGRAAVEVCQRLRTWTLDITLLAHYTRSLRSPDIRKLKEVGINIERKPVEELVGKKGKLSGVKLAGGKVLKCDALFFSAPFSQHSTLAVQLGCEFTRSGNVDFHSHQRTNVPGLFVAGDMARDMQLMVIAAAEGAKAGVVINAELNKENRDR